MRYKDIYSRFIEYFIEHGHTHLPSSPVIPVGDTTLLFTNAGMNQFKPYFLGTKKPQHLCVTTAQKCIRVGGKHNDLENVGHTARHMTFFEMIGNFSFGDYFKDGSIAYAYEVTKNVFQFDMNRIYVSVHTDDDEAYELWSNYFPKERIIRMGDKDNFWQMGDKGLCGPCSELYYDRGAAYGNATSPLDDENGDRFIEFWNLVFMQFDQLEKNDAESRHPIQKPCIDTGAGIERVAMLSQNVATVFEIDSIQEIIQSIQKHTRIKYDPQSSNAPAFHVIADHMRSLCFAINDGALPSNVDRGYVLRKLVRRAMRYGKSLDIEGTFLHLIVDSVVSSMGEFHPTLSSKAESIKKTLQKEEDSFLKTLKKGGQLMSYVIEKTKAGNQIISGEDAFKLKDTYGLPLDEILLLAKDSHLSVDQNTFLSLEKEAKMRSKQDVTQRSSNLDHSIFQDFEEKHGTIENASLKETQLQSTIVGINKDSSFSDKIEEGEKGEIILDITPFYGEKGGQVGDTGMISHNGAFFEVTKTTYKSQTLIVHSGVMKKGSLIVSEPVHAQVNEKRRHSVSKNHTATHLLHFFLEKHLGSNIRQAGSFVSEEKLRFDFTHDSVISPESLAQIEEDINAAICSNHSVTTYEVPFTTIDSDPSIKQFFGDAYGDVVRVVDIGLFGKELCGGTHVQSLSEIGIFKIQIETSTGSGIRRIEAITGQKGWLYLKSLQSLVESVQHALKAPSQDVIIHKLNSLQTSHKELEHLVESAYSQQANETSRTLIEDKSSPVQVLEIDTLPKKYIGLIGKAYKEHTSAGQLLICTKTETSCSLYVFLGDDVVKKGYNASHIVKSLASFIKGSGGGRNDTAQAGGTYIPGIKDAMRAFKSSSF